MRKTLTVGDEVECIDDMGTFGFLSAHRRYIVEKDEGEFIVVSFSGKLILGSFYKIQFKLVQKCVKL